MLRSSPLTASGHVTVPVNKTIMKNTTKKQSTERKDPRNYTIVARGTRIFEKHDDLFGQCVFGFRDMQVWDVTSQSWQPLSKDPDKFIISSDDPETIADLFFDKWRTYCQRRFKHNITIESN